MVLDWKTLPAGKEKYQAYLASREWALLKQAIRGRSGGRCEHCRSAVASQVHHQTYRRLYAEALADLLHVCEPCHLFLSGRGDHNPAARRASAPISRVVECKGCLAGTYFGRIAAIIGLGFDGPEDDRFLYVAFELLRLWDGHTRFVFGEEYFYDFDRSSEMMQLYASMEGRPAREGEMVYPARLLGRHCWVTIECTKPDDDPDGFHFLGHVRPGTFSDARFLHEPVIWHPSMGEFPAVDWLPTIGGRSVRDVATRPMVPH